MNFNLDEVQNGTVVDQNGDKIGSVGQIYLDDVTDQPTWVTVNTGLFGNKESFIPLNGADISGSEIRVPYTKDFVKDAPNVDDDGHIGEAEQDELYRYYSMDNTRTDVDVDRAAAADAGLAEAQLGQVVLTRRPPGPCELSPAGSGPPRAAGGTSPAGTAPRPARDQPAAAGCGDHQPRAARRDAGDRGGALRPGRRGRAGHRRRGRYTHQP